MSLDLMISQTVGSYNITHNLTDMADKVKIDGVTLYQVLWRGDENGFEGTEETRNYLKKAIPYLIENKEELIKFNPENGWGSYDGLLKFCKNVLSDCYIKGYITYDR